MKVTPETAFLKDIHKLKNQKLKDKVFDFLKFMEAADELQQLSNIKKMKNTDFAYRWKSGDYRLGFTFDGEEIRLKRILHRKDIYKSFP